MFSPQKLEKNEFLKIEVFSTFYIYTVNTL